MMIMFRLLLLLLAATLTLSGQEELLRTRLYTVGLKESVAGLYFRNSGKPAELRAAITGMGPGVNYVGSPVMALYESEEAMLPPKKGEKPTPPLAVVKLPKGHDRVLLVIGPVPEGKKAPSLHAYGISTGDLKAGDYRFFNFSNSGVSVILGSKKLGLKPGAVSTVGSNEWKREVIDLPIKLGQVGEDSKIKPVYSSVWGHQPLQRNFVMVLPGPGRARPLDVRRFYDVPGVEAAGAAVGRAESQP